MAQPFIDGRHIREVCEHFEYVTEGLVQNLVVNIPPGFTKSKTFQVFWPVWSWLRYPNLAFCFASIDPGIPMREAKSSLDLMTSDWFRDRWGDRFHVAEGQAVGEFWNDKGGLRFSTSEGGAAIGWHFDIIGVDDPHKPQNLNAEALGKTANWWRETMASRAKDRATLRRVVVMQRLHELDLSQVCVDSGEYEHLYLPMRYEPERKCVTSVGGDWRTEPGELLCEARANAETVTKWEATLVSAADGQLQQRPGKAGGNIFQSEWLTQRHQIKPSGLVVQSWDFNFKDKDQMKPGKVPDFVVGQVWALIGNQFYLLHQVRSQTWTFAECLDQVRSVSLMFPSAITKLVEAKANGPAIVSQLQQEIVGFELVEPMGDKPSRAHAVSPLFKANQVWLADGALWVPDYVRELVAFPKGRNDDQVDTTTQALLWLAPRVGGDQKAANDALEALLRGR